ncbi:MAG: methyltransferase [Niabella sp.]
MHFPLQLEIYSVGNIKIEIYVPDVNAVYKFYHNNKEAAYWTKVWPASIGLCRFMWQYPQFIKDKRILELATGLGLCGLFAAHKANHVCITDREPLAAEYVNRSAAHLQLSNVKTMALDWKEASLQPLPDVVLLSDVNYKPEVFEELQKVIEYFLNHGVTIIISTPQRLMAREFINPIRSYCVQQENFSIRMNHKETGVSVFVLIRQMVSF